MTNFYVNTDGEASPYINEVSVEEQSYLLSFLFIMLIAVLSVLAITL